jgi:iron(III) transport system ATP-binding protein
MRFEIKDLQRRHGATILYVTHDQEVALALSDRIGILDQQGRLRQVGAPRDVYERPVDLNVFRFMGISSFVDVSFEGEQLRVAGTCADVLLSGTRPPGALVGGFRPMEAELVREGGVPGTVRRVALLGAMVDIRVEVGGRELRLQQETSELMQGVGLPEEGQPCSVRFHHLRLFAVSALAGEG